MSISVSSNPDGTFTITCGTESVVIGQSSIQKASSAATLASATGHTKPKEVHFALDGRHTLDVGKLSAITGGDSSGLVTHIHIGRHRG